MRSFSAGVAGLTALSAAALTANSYVLPASVGDQRFADDEAAGYSKRDAAPVFAKRNEGQSLRLELTHSKRETLDSFEKVKAFAVGQKEYIKKKYGKSSSSDAEKRQVAGLIDYGPDSFYFAQVAVGTPAQNFNVILDTGSADFWLADSQCTSSQCAGVNLYNPGASSTSTTSQTPFQIQYGSGAVRGTLNADTAALAGYTVYNTTVAGVTQLAQDTLRSPTSGIMGMGFEQLATSGATPFWEVLAKSGTLGTQAFSFQLQRNTMASETALSSGGVFTLGEIDSNQYQGDITYTNLPSSTIGRAGYWAIPLDNVQLNGQSISTNGQTAAIDTGTTLIGAPQDVAESIYSQIQDAQPVNVGGGDDSGYYAYPCSTNVTVAFTFGGKSWTVSPEDFNGGAVAQSRDGTTFCLGSIFGADLGSGTPEWIVGDSFLKNVFSVYEYSPGPRVGFAELKNGQAQNAPVTISLVPSGTAANKQQVSSTPSASASTGNGVGPPSLSIDSSAATQTNIVGGSGLPVPVAANAVATSQNLTPSSSTVASSSSPPSVISSTSTPSSSSDPSTSTSIVTDSSSSSQPSLTTGSNSLSGGSSGAASTSASGALLLSAGAATVFALVAGGLFL